MTGVTAQRSFTAALMGILRRQGGRGPEREVRRQNREMKSYVRDERGAPAETVELAVLRRDLRIYFDQASDVKVLHGGAN